MFYPLELVHPYIQAQVQRLHICMYLPGSAPSRCSQGHCSTHSCSSPCACDGQVFVTAALERNSHSGSMPSGECVRQESRTEWRQQICSWTPHKLQPLSHNLAYTAVLNLPDPTLSHTLPHTLPPPPLEPHQTPQYL